jgi:hypothetical protein
MSPLRAARLGPTLVSFPDFSPDGLAMASWIDLYNPFGEVPFFRVTRDGRQSCSSDRRISRAKSSMQRLARSTLVKISASDSPASSSASAALNRLRDSGGTAP